MGTRRTGTKNRWKQWKPAQARRALAGWRASGLPLARYARRRGVSARRLSWWRDRLGEWSDGAPGGGGARLVPAIVTSAPVVAPAVAVTVRLPGEVTLEVSDVAAVSAEWVAAVVGKLSRGG